MIKHKQFELITTETLSISEETLMAHTHDYYEFIFIRKGKGKHLVKEEVVDFEPGDLFFISPGEGHAFQIWQHAEANVIRINEQMRVLLKSYLSQWNLQAVVITRAKSPLNSPIHLEPGDRLICEQIFGLIAQLVKQPARNESVILHQMVSLITVMDRNIHQMQKEQAETNGASVTIERMIKHIHKYMRQPEKLSVSYLSEAFNIPMSYIGSFFKRNTSESLKQYINQCRMVMIGRKIRHGNSSFSEIAYDFGFTDESHFLKNFRKFYGVSPSEYRHAAQS